jgi:hypothetical protein
MFFRTLLIVGLFSSSIAAADEIAADNTRTAETQDQTTTDSDSDSDRGWWCPTHSVYDQCPLNELTEAELSEQEQSDADQMATDLAAAEALERAWWCPIHSAYDTHPIIDAQGW